MQADREEKAKQWEADNADKYKQWQEEREDTKQSVSFAYNLRRWNMIESAWKMNVLKRCYS
ncbi:hypothetical protein PPTG_22197 [Phytophthora nicotianae INRA-310]|uniref:Uncharacterized protein n=2 Tax=Phytophthora nicotianae TaxID=4792 RepID=W2QLQ4_PHYN3|nr:hypothetical protein PPTG_22197 [Phytophthora nicotianae INRA-310]ETN14117.1 hypothetical protein PPTG_22197 [Phytophthora nicotianae INRA-310]ETO79699.1 hypothetical protein F444_05676 [Phytophthora nicotianae P1976]